mmetsp:Transcript_332/g.368  ORF Transcript_332/g.368 Transcript_332/m.368 type:complete len:91 (-) Transcript_332:887-1159(-)
MRRNFQNQNDPSNVEVNQVVYSNIHILNHFLFFMSYLFFSVLKLRNLKTLFYRFLTVGLVLAHYSTVERVSWDDRVKNEWQFLGFLLVWH